MWIISSAKFSGNSTPAEVIAMIGPLRARISWMLDKLLLKISPDINELELEKIISLAIDYDIQGMIISNTTTKHKSHSGGLSGRPLFTKSNNLLSRAYKMAEGKLIFIGVGGIFSGKDIFEKMAAGASLVQLYTSLTYKGFQVIQNSKVELQEILKNKGFNSVKEIIGINVK